MTTKTELSAIVARLESEKAKLFDLSCRLQTENTRAHAALDTTMRRNAYLETENIRLHTAIRELVKRYVRPTEEAVDDRRE